MFTNVCKAQVNLVPNPSFESYATCPTNCDIAALKYWVNPTDYSPDYFHSCVSNSSCSTPQNLYGNQVPDDSSGYTGIVTGAKGSSQSIREYIQVKLLDTLKPNNSYQFSMRISVADSVKYIYNNIGAYFSSVAVTSTNNLVLSYIPQINFGTINSGSSKTGWFTLSNTLTVQSNVQYLTIGNFVDDANSLIDSFPSVGNYLSAFSYVYIDNVKINKIITGLEELENSTSIKVYQNFSEDLIINSSSEILKVEILSLMGFPLISKSFGRTYNANIPVSSLSKGVYFVNIHSGNRISNKKIIIN